MSIDRYLFLSSALHFAGDAQASPTDKIWKIRNFFELMNTQLTNKFKLSQDISVDESLLLWKGNHSIRRYVPNKAAKFGFKMYCLADSTLRMQCFKQRSYASC